MKLTKWMWRIGIWTLLLPVFVVAACQVLIWLIPDCNPNPYAVQGCMVAGVSLASALVIGQLGGTYIAIALGLMVSLPLFVISMLLDWLKRKIPSN